MANGRSHRNGPGRIKSARPGSVKTTDRVGRSGFAVGRKVMHRSKLTGPDAADVAAAGSAAGLAFDRVTDAILSRETGP